MHILEVLDDHLRLVVGKLYGYKSVIKWLVNLLGHNCLVEVPH